MEAAPCFAHEAVIGTGILHKTQALAGGIGLTQGDLNCFAILGRDQGISRAEHTVSRADPGQQIYGGLTATGRIRLTPAP